MTKETLSNFQKKVTKLLLNIEEWSKNNNLVTERTTITISEEDCGTYQTEKLLICQKTGQKIAQIIPIASSVLGANGRVDIEGNYDSVILVDLNKGGPTITATITENKPQTRKLYRGINEDGWYWFERKASSKGHKMTQNLFLDILEEISDYVPS